MKAIHLYTACICLLLSSCGGANTAPVAVVADPSEKYVGTWRCHEYGSSKQTLTIRNVEGRFFIYPKEFYSWDGDNGMTGKTVPAEYDKERDKLVVTGVEFYPVDIVYNPVNKSLIVGKLELFREPEQGQ